MNPNAEFDTLTDEQRSAVEQAIRLARSEPGRHQIDGGASGDAYAYQSGDSVHWGFNAHPTGRNAARGVVPLTE
jgi:hypothetical protein